MKVRDYIHVLGRLCSLEVSSLINKAYECLWIQTGKNLPQSIPQSILQSRKQSKKKTFHTRQPEISHETMNIPA